MAGSVIVQGGLPEQHCQGGVRGRAPVGVRGAHEDQGRARGQVEVGPDEACKRYLQDRLEAGGTILIVAVPGDEGVAAIEFGAGAEPELSRPRLIQDGEPAK